MNRRESEKLKKAILGLESANVANSGNDCMVSRNAVLSLISLITEEEDTNQEETETLSERQEQLLNEALEARRRSWVHYCHS